MADLLVNAGLGFGVGIVASVILFRRESTTAVQAAGDKWKRF